MHGIPAGNGLRYTCGTYVNSGGAKCGHNWILQDSLLPDVLSTIRESALPKVEDLRNTLRKLVAELNAPGRQQQDNAALQKECDRQGRIVEKALESMSRAQDEEERQGLRQIYRRERA